MSQQNSLSPLGARIDAVRQRRTLTLYHVAKKAKMDYSQLYRTMRTVKSPARESLVRICRAIGCTPIEAAEIFKGTGYVPPSMDELEEEVSAA